MRNRLFLGLCVLLLATAGARAEDVSLTGGTIAKFTPAGAQIKFAKDPGLTNFPDPRCPSVTSVSISTDAGIVNSDVCPCSKWTFDGNKYVYLDAPGTCIGITKMEWRGTSLAMELTGPRYVMPAGPVGYVSVVLSVGPDSHGFGPDNYCAVFRTFAENSSTVIAATKPSEACDPSVFNTATPVPTNTPPGPSATPTQTFTPLPTNTPRPTNTPGGVQPTAFRVTSLYVRDPHLYPFGPGSDGTDFVNSIINGTYISGDSNPADGNYDLSLIAVFRPLNQANGIPPTSMSFGSATCTVAGVNCTAGSLIDTTYTNTASGACASTVPGTTGMNNSGAYSPPISIPQGPCAASAVITTAPFALGTLTIPLSNVQIAGEYVGNPATQIFNGLVMGFLRKTDADNTPLPPPLAGNLSSILLVGDQDTFNSEIGWWFYLNFEAGPVGGYTGP